MKDSWLWLVLGGVGFAIYYYKTKPQAAPLSIYPEYGYTAQTSMAASPKQKATTVVQQPIPLFQSVQAEQQAAILSQCAGSYPACTILTADTQLGF